MTSVDPHFSFLMIICPGLTIINFHYEFLTRAPSLSNQKAVFIGYDVLDVLPTTRNKIILEDFVTIRVSLERGVISLLLWNNISC
jgi:hypothetical protein